MLTILSIHANAMDQIIPLYLLNPKDHGGFGFKSSDIGIMYCFAGPFQLLSALFFYPQWIKWFGYRRNVIYYNCFTYNILFTFVIYSKSISKKSNNVVYLPLYWNISSFSCNVFYIHECID